MKQNVSLKESFDFASSFGLSPAKEKETFKIALFNRKEEDRERFAKIAGTLIASQFGYDTLKIASDLGYRFGFVESGDKIAGFCDSSKKVIALSPDAPDDYLVGVLAHEARHAGQHDRDADANIEKDNVKTQVMFERACEADADAAFARSTYELKEKGFTKPFAYLEKSRPDIAKAFEENAIKYGSDSDEAMTAAFKAWYGSERIKDAYDKAYLIDRMLDINEKGMLHWLDFSKDKSPETIVKKTCATEKGFWGWRGNYFNEKPKILETESFLGISQEAKDFLTKIFKWRAKNGLSQDKSFDSIPVRKVKPKPKVEQSKIKLDDFCHRLR